MVQACPECILSPCLPISHYRKVGGSKNKEVTSLQGCLHHRCLPGRGWYFKPGRAHIFTPQSLPDLAICWGEEAGDHWQRREEAEKRRSTSVIAWYTSSSQLLQIGNSPEKKMKSIKIREDWIKQDLSLKARKEGKTFGGVERKPGWADFYPRGGVAVAGLGRSQGWQGWPFCFSTSILSSSLTPLSPSFNH